MKTIYILLMQTNTRPARIVRFFTRYKYSHVAISLDKSCYTTYSFGRRKVKSILGGGYIIEKQDGKFFTFFNNTICRIYELEVSDKQYNDLKDLLEDMKKNHYDEYKYDFIGIVLRYLGIPIIRKNKFVCSNFVAYALEKANIYKFDKKTCMIRPLDFESIKNKKEIYEGYYKDYLSNR